MIRLKTLIDAAFSYHSQYSSLNIQQTSTTVQCISVSSRKKSLPKESLSLWMFLCESLSSSNLNLKCCWPTVNCDWTVFCSENKCFRKLRMLAVIYNLENVQFKNPFSSLGTVISYLVLGKDQTTKNLVTGLRKFRKGQFRAQSLVEKLGRIKIFLTQLQFSQLGKKDKERSLLTNQRASTQK